MGGGTGEGKEEDEGERKEEGDLFFMLGVNVFTDLTKDVSATYTGISP